MTNNIDRKHLKIVTTVAIIVAIYDNFANIDQPARSRFS